MKHRLRIVLSSLAVIAMDAAPVFAQEVLVSGQYRRGYAVASPNVSAPTQLPSVIGLRRNADFVVQSVILTGDTRDAETRLQELQATVLAAIAQAQRSGLQLAVGTEVLEPLTQANHRQLLLGTTGRPDTVQTTVQVKVPLTTGMTLNDTGERIAAFVKAVKPVGRTTIAVSGDPALSVLEPDQYRGQIVDLIAADAKAMSARFGPGHGVQVTGLDRPVQWRRTGATEVMLYLPGWYLVVPASR
ncbi:TonB-dependent receptor [Sphingomonas sp. CJ99]